MIIIVWGTSEEPRFLFRSGGVRAEVTHQLSDKTRQRRIYKVPRPSSQGCLFSSSGFETTCESNKARGVAAGSRAAVLQNCGTAQQTVLPLPPPCAALRAPRAAPQPCCGWEKLTETFTETNSNTDLQLYCHGFVKQHHRVSLHKVCCCC